MMRIGVVAAQLPPDPGGLGETVWAKHRWLAARGVESRIITYTPQFGAPLRHPAMTGREIIRYEPLARVGGSFFRRLRDVRAMVPLLHETLADCDVIEMQGWTLWNAAFALRPGPLARKPWVMVFRGTDGWGYRPRAVMDLKARVNHRATTLANSRGLAAHLRRLGLRMDGHIWSEVDPSLFPAHEEAPEPGRLITVKGLYPVGDPETLVRALAILKKRGVPFRFVHLGRGPLLEPMLRLCRTLSIEREVEFLNQVPHAEIPAHLAHASVKVLSSRLESCPHVIGEAMMSARPVVATATSGAAELIRDGETGWLVRIGDPEDLADKIARVLSDPEGAREMGRRARAWALANLHVDVLFRRYLDLYGSLLERGDRLPQQLRPTPADSP
jgi:glycosyltransferase involved in cell wall biosynthesis